MSYEGFTQNICKNGHLFEADCHESPKCPYCNQKPVFVNNVDQTNWDDYGLINMGEFKVKESESCICSCGNCHTKAPAIYRIPNAYEAYIARGIKTVNGKIEKKVYIYGKKGNYEVTGNLLPNNKAEILSAKMLKETKEHDEEGEYVRAVYVNFTLSKSQKRDAIKKLLSYNG